MNLHRRLIVIVLSLLYQALTQYQMIHNLVQTRRLAKGEVRMSEISLFVRFGISLLRQCLSSAAALLVIVIKNQIPRLYILYMYKFSRVRNFANSGFRTDSRELIFT